MVDIKSLSWCLALLQLFCAVGNLQIEELACPMDPSSVRGWISQSHLASISGEHLVRPPKKESWLENQWKWYENDMKRIWTYDHDIKCLSECCAPFFNPASMRLTIAVRDMRSWQAHNTSMRRFILRKQARTSPTERPCHQAAMAQIVGPHKNTEIQTYQQLSTYQIHCKPPKVCWICHIHS